METEITHEADEIVISFIVKEVDLPLIIEALCIEGGYQSKVMNEDLTELIDNPVEPKDFAWRMIRDMAINPAILLQKKKDAEQVLSEIPTRQIIVKG